MLVGPSLAGYVALTCTWGPPTRPQPPAKTNISTRSPPARCTCHTFPYKIFTALTGYSPPRALGFLLPAPPPHPTTQTHIRRTSPPAGGTRRRSSYSTLASWLLLLRLKSRPTSCVAEALMAARRPASMGLCAASTEGAHATPHACILASRVHTWGCGLRRKARRGCGLSVQLKARGHNGAHH
jgi:hypothetical protein